MSAPADHDQFEKLLGLPLSPVTLRRIMLLLFREHYSDMSQFGAYRDLLGDLTYNDDPKKSTLAVDLLHAYDPKKVSGDPSIFIGFQPFQFTKKGVDNYAGMNDDESVIYKTMAAAGILIVRHCASASDMALLMGESSTNMLLGLQELLKNRLKLLGFDISTLSDPKMISPEPQRMFYCDLACQVSFNYTISVNMESHRLKKIVWEYQAENNLPALTDLQQVNIASSSLLASSSNTLASQS